MGSDFETRRLQEEEARRARAAARDAERRQALASGARAPSHADGSDATGVLRAASIGVGGLAAASLVLGLVTFGSVFAVLGFGGAAVFGATAFALHRLRSKQLESRRSSDARLASLAASTLTSAPEHEQAWRRAKGAVEAAQDLDPSRRKAILRALDAARKELAAGAAPDRVEAFIGRCAEIATSLEGLPPSKEAPPTAFDHLDALTTDLTQEASARAEIDEALRTARASTGRQVEG